MKIIKNSKELAKLVDENKDLHLENEDVRIEFQMTDGEVRDVYCRDLFLMNDEQRFNFNGRDFTGGDFNGKDFNGRDFTGRDFNGGDFTGGNFTGWNFDGWNFYGRDFYGNDFNGNNFIGRNVSYNAFFNCYEGIKCEDIAGREFFHSKPVCLGSELEIVKPKEN